MSISARIIAIVFGACIATHASGQVYKCTEGGKTVYADQPCGADAKPIEIAPDQKALERGKMKPGTQLDISDAMAAQCWNGYRKFARDPTTAKYLSHFAKVADDGFPYIYVNVVLTNKNGGPNRRFVRCRLNYDMTMNDSVTDDEHTAFFRSEMDMWPIQTK